MGTRGRRLAQAFCLIVFLVLLFYVGWPGRLDYGGEDGAAPGPVELPLILDPLVAVSTAIAAKTMVWSLAAAGVVLLICLVLVNTKTKYLVNNVIGHC